MVVDNKHLPLSACIYHYQLASTTIYCFSTTKCSRSLFANHITRSATVCQQAVCLVICIPRVLI